MIARAACAAIVLAGCNMVLGLEPATLSDPLPPSCAAGWASRIPIDITNASSGPLVEYQVPIPLDPSMLPELRFGTDASTQPLRFEPDHDGGPIWVAVPELPVGTTTLYAYVGNPGVDAWVSPSPFEPEIIANPSFESDGAWTIGEPGAHYELSTSWASDGERSMLIDAYRGERVFRTLDYGVSQRARFPPGSDYVVRFDLGVVAASNSGWNSHGEFFVSVGEGLVSAWRLSGQSGNITGVHRDLETIPFGAGDVGILFGVTLVDGTSASYAKGFYDHVRVRKHVTPEPVVAVGAEEACPD